MAEEYGTRAEDCICAIGPSICQDCYEVSSDVAERFREQYRDRLRDLDILQPGQKPGKYQLGLWKAIRMVLLDCGVLPERISVTDICTRCNCGYLYSHRITGFERGNMAAFLSIAD
jgi:copper oxidase (laccase) domain-containing protein